jgi:WD40 repeat protein
MEPHVRWLVGAAGEIRQLFFGCNRRLYAATGQGAYLQTLRWWDDISAMPSGLMELPEWPLFITHAGSIDLIANTDRDLAITRDTSGRVSSRVQLVADGVGPAIAISPNGKLLAVACRRRGERPAVAFFELPSGQATGVVLHMLEYPRWIALNPAGRYLAVVGLNGAFTMWDLIDRESVIARRYLDFRAAAFSADGSTFVVATRRSLQIYDGRADQVRATVAVSNDRSFRAVCISPDGRVAITAGRSGRRSDITLWDTSNGRMLNAFDWDFIFARSVAISPDGLTAVAGGERGRIVVWDLDV